MSWKALSEMPSKSRILSRRLVGVCPPVDVCLPPIGCRHWGDPLLGFLSASIVTRCTMSGRARLGLSELLPSPGSDPELSGGSRGYEKCAPTRQRNALAFQPPSNWRVIPHWFDLGVKDLLDWLALLNLLLWLGCWSEGWKILRWDFPWVVQHGGTEARAAAVLGT